MRRAVGEGDLIALDLAAVGLGDLAGESYRLRELDIITSGVSSEIRGLDGVLAILVAHQSLGVGDFLTSLCGAGGGVAVLFIVHLHVLDILGARSFEGFFSARLLQLELGAGGHHELGGVRLIGVDHDVERAFNADGVLVLSGGGVSRGTDQCEGCGQGERRKSRQDGQGPRDAVGDGRCHAHTVAVQMPGCNRIVMGIVPRRVCYWNCCGGGQAPCCWGGQARCCWGGQVLCCWGACVGEGG